PASEGRAAYYFIQPFNIKPSEQGADLERSWLDAPAGYWPYGLTAKRIEGANDLELIETIQDLTFRFQENVENERRILDAARAADAIESSRRDRPRLVA